MTARVIAGPVKDRSALLKSALIWIVGLGLALLAGQLASAYLRDRGMPLSVSFLGYPAGFDMSESVIEYSGSDSYGYAFVAGCLNTLKVSLLGIAFSSALALLIALCRLARNPLLSGLARAWVETTRNIPLILHLFAWYAAITYGLPDNRHALEPLKGVVLSNRGIWLPGIDAAGSGGWLLLGGVVLALGIRYGLGFWQRQQAGRATRIWGLKWPIALLGAGFGTWIAAVMSGLGVSVTTAHLDGFSMSGGTSVSAEFAALLIGLTVYTSGSLAEVFRGAIVSVPKAQTEAALSVGLGPLPRLRLIILPQALRIGLPPTINQFLNLLKNSSLAVAVGFPDLVSVGNTAINQTGQALVIIFIFLVFYVSLGLLISTFMRSLTKHLDHVA